MKFVVINQDYEIVSVENISIDNEQAKFVLMARFDKERRAMAENGENIIEDDVFDDGMRARLFYEDNGEVLGYAMYII